MKTLILTILMAFFAVPAMAAEGSHKHADSQLHPLRLQAPSSSRISGSYRVHFGVFAGAWDKCKFQPALP